MTKAKDWLFLFPLICIALMVISLFLPIMHIIIKIPLVPLTVEGDVLPFGGGLLNELETYKALFPVVESELTNFQNIFMGVGIGFAVFYTIDILLLFINAIRVKTGSKELKKTRKKWLSGGLSKIIGEVVVILIMLFVVPGALVGSGVIFGFTMGLGMIMTMIAGGVLIFAYVLAKIAG